MTVDKEQVLRSSPLFDMLSPPELEVLAELSRPRRFAAGEVVFHEGDQGDSLFVLARGEVEVVARRAPQGAPSKERGSAASADLDGAKDGAKERVLAVLGAPAAFGEMALIDREVRSATVRAKQDCVALQLSAENFTAFRKRSRDGFTLFLVNVARVLSSRLRETNHKLASR
jgi:CRP/FNR family cyclic AMP-dependent transcriptional regulator